MTYMLDTIGSGDMLWTLFNALAALLRPNGGTLWQSFIVLGTAIGAGTALGYTVFRNSFRPISTWFITTQVIILGLISPVSTLHIRDELTGFNRSVDNVPFALAFTASTLSSIGTGITKAIETVFQPAPNYVGGSGFNAPSDDHLRYSQTGFMFASNVMSQMKGIQLANDDLMDNMKEFVNQCVVYDALIGNKYTLHDLKRSNDLWKLVSEKASKLRGFAWRNVNRSPDGVLLEASHTEIVTCKVGVDRLNAMWREASQSLVSDFQTKLGETCGFTSRTTPALSNAVAMNLPGALNKLTHAGKGASEQLQQQVMISSILKANDTKTQELGGSSNLDVRRAYLQQRSMYQTIGETIAHGLPSLKNVLEAVIYALFIFVVLASMLPSGWKMLTFYTKLLLWIQLWPPFFAILNFIMTETLSSKTAGILGTTSGITIANMVGLSNLTQDMAAIAGYLAVFIPVLSWALIELGGYSFVSMVSSVLGVSQSAATNASLEKVHGNYSAGNVSLEGTQAFNSSFLKHDASGSYTGNHFSSNEGVISKTTTADGEVLLNQSGSHMHVTPTLQHSKEEMWRDTQMKLDALQTSQSEAASENYRSALSNYVGFSQLASKQKELGVGYANDITTNIMEEASKNYEKIQQIGEKYGIEQSVIDQRMTTFSAGLGISKFLPVELGVQYQKSAQSQAIANAATEEMNQVLASESFRESMQHVQQASQTRDFRLHDSKLKQLTNDMSTSLDVARQHETSSNKLREKSQAIQRERANNHMYGAHTDANLTQEWVNETGAEKLQGMSLQEQLDSANRFTQQKMAAYRSSKFHELHLDVIERELDKEYKNHTVGANAESVTNGFNVHQKNIEQQAFAHRVPTHIDTTPQKHVKQMIATQQSILQSRGSHMKEKVTNTQKSLNARVDKHHNENFSLIQKLETEERYQEMRARNSKA